MHTNKISIIQAQIRHTGLSTTKIYNAMTKYSNTFITLIKHHQMLIHESAHMGLHEFQLHPHRGNRYALCTAVCGSCPCTEIYDHDDHLDEAHGPKHTKIWLEKRRYSSSTSPHLL